MPTNKPRINVVVDPSLYGQVERIAHERGISMSLVARDLIKEALETEEDIGLERVAEQRESTLYRDRALSHEDTWE